MSELLALLISGYLMLAPQGCVTLDASELRATLRTEHIIAHGNGGWGLRDHSYSLADDIDEFVALAMAESGGDTCAINRNGWTSDAPGSADHGVWQINDYFWGDLDVMGLPRWRTDFRHNLKGAILIRFLQGWDAWATWRGSAEATCDYWTARGRTPC